MLNSVTAKSVIDHALFLGADFAELFVEHHQTNTVQIASGEVDKVNSGIDFGIGIRLFSVIRCFTVTPTALMKLN